MNPWLQRFLVSWAAGIAATGAIVSTAKQPGKLKEKKRRARSEGSEEPVVVGTVALRDAKAPANDGLTVSQWRDDVAASARGVRERVAAVFGSPSPNASMSQPSEDPGSAALAQDHGAPRQGLHRQGPAQKRRAAGRAKGRQGKKPRRRRPQATLWDSAKESLRQTVKDTVREEVQASPVGTALDALKNVGAKVRDGASTAASAAQSAIQKALEQIDVPPPPAPPARDPTAAPHASSSPHEDRPLEVRDQAAVPVDASATETAPEGRVRSDSEASSSKLGPTQAQPSTSASATDVEQMARKVKAGADTVGAWLQGPGAPGYRSKRIRPASIGTVAVDAKDPTDATSAVDAKSSNDSSGSSDSSDSNDPTGPLDRNVGDGRASTEVQEFIDAKGIGDPTDVDPTRGSPGPTDSVARTENDDRQ